MKKTILTAITFFFLISTASALDVTIAIPDAVIPGVQEWVQNYAPQTVTRLNAAGTEMVTIERVTVNPDTGEETVNYGDILWFQQLIYKHISDQILSMKRQKAREQYVDTVQGVALPE